MSSGMNGSEELLNKHSYANSLQAVSQMQSIPEFTPSSDDDSLVFALIKKIPFLGDFLKETDESGALISALLDSKSADSSSSSLNGATAGFHYAHAGLALIDFIRIPLMYLAAAILGKELPFKLSRLGKITYSAIILGLAISVIVVPGLAAALGLVSASLGLMTSVYLLARHIDQRGLLKLETKSLTQAITVEKGVLAEIQEQSRALGEQLENAIEKQDWLTAEKLSNDISKMKGVYDQTVSQLQSLEIEQHTVQQKLLRFDDKSLIDKAVGASLTAFLVIGLTLAMFFPPVGFGIAAASALLSVAYITKRLVIPFVMNKIAQFNERRAGLEAEVSQNEQGEDVDSPEVEEVAEPAPPVHESTTDAIKIMSGERAVQKLKEQIDEFKTSPELEKEPVFVKKVIGAVVKDDESEGEREKENEGEGERRDLIH